MTVPSTNVFISPYAIEKSSTSFSRAYSSGVYIGAMRCFSTPQNSAIVYPVFLSKGIYTIGLIYTKGAGNGIYSVRLDDIEKGTVDGYAASSLFQQVSEIAGVTISESKVYDLKLLLATKNASSTGYASDWSAIYLIRTGGTLDETVSGDYPNGIWSWPCVLGAQRTQGFTKGVGGTGGTFFSYANISNVNTNYMEWDLWLKAGTYALEINGQSATDKAIATISLDGVTVMTSDFYAAGSQWSRRTQSGIVVANDGLHTLRLANPTKNASSSGYAIFMATMTLVRA